MRLPKKKRILMEEHRLGTLLQANEELTYCFRLVLCLLSNKRPGLKNIRLSVSIQ